MTLSTNSMGLMANYTNILNASNYATADSRIVQDTSGGYADDDYVQCVVADTAMLELGPFPDLTFAGPYKLFIHGYTGTPTSYLDVYLDVYEDDTLVTWTTGSHTSGEIYIETYKPEVWINFDPDKEYRLVLRTGASTSDTLPTVVDYLHLQPISPTFTEGVVEWSYRGQHTITGGVPTTTYSITGMPVVDTALSANLQGTVSSGTVYSAVTGFGSSGIDLWFQASSGNLPATFVVWVDASALIELPYIRDNGDV